MAAITIRMDDATKSALETLARGRGQSLSELARSALEDLLSPPAGRANAWIDMTPTSLTVVERQQLALLHRILARVVGEDNDGIDGDKTYQFKRAEVLEKGFVGDYSDEFIGIAPEMSVEDSRFVIDVLNMFRIITFSLKALKEPDAELSEVPAFAFEFIGFDQNDARETRLLSWTRHLIDSDHWGELSEQFSEHDNGNSHSRMAPVYERMLDEYNRIQARKRNNFGLPGADFLTAKELVQIGRAHAHPDNRSDSSIKR